MDADRRFHNFIGSLATEPTSLNEENHTREDEITKEDEERVKD
jgi:hypothetical protein